MINAAWTELDSFVEAFERARAAGPVPDLTRFAPPPDHELHCSVLRELIRVDLEFGWSEGRPATLADYRRRYPNVFADADHAREIEFEESRLRRQCLAVAESSGNPILPSSSFRSSVRSEPTERPTEIIGDRDDPMTAAASAYLQSRAMREPAQGNGADESPHVALFRAMYRRDPAAADRLARAVHSWPDVGDQFCGFRLVAELGRGAFGRVFLAQQAELADRPVALKVVCDIRGEAQHLARLQHTNVMPIYSVHASEPFHALCMPSFGGTTLDRLLADRQAMPSAIRQLVCWAERLADGLAHAHERGVLHRDIKPANILITADDVPMLLDFNLAADVSPLGPEALQIGGTLAYMPPEALESVLGNGLMKADARSDVYSLGVVLWELLAGRHPFPQPSGAVRDVLPRLVSNRRRPPDVRSVNVEVSPALAAIVARCLSPNPDDRYATARQLQEDLARQLSDQPLRHTREPSWIERARKWRRRHPRVAVAVLAAAILTPLVLFAVQQHRDASIARAEQSVAEFRQEKKWAATVLKLPGIAPVDQKLARDRARKAIEQWDESTGQAPWGWISESQRAELRRDLGELLLVSAAAEVRSASRDDPKPNLAEAARLNTAAEKYLRGAAGERALWRQRAAIAQLSGHAQESDYYRKLESAAPMASALDRHPLILEAWESGRFREAIARIREALDASPDEAFLWHALAEAHMRLEEFDLAYGYLDASRALFPDFYRTYYQRGIIELSRRRPQAALADFDRTLQLQPNYFPAYMQRAVARTHLGDRDGAMADLDVAREHAAALLPRPPAQIEFMRALLLSLLGDAAGARRAREAGLAQPPIDADDWVIRGLSRIDDDPRAAQADFEEALRLDPRHPAALRNLAHVLAESLGQAEQSLAALDRLIERWPDSAADLSGRGVVLARLGRRDDAHRDARAALKSNPGPLTRYQVAGIYALTARTNPPDALEAVRLLTSAFREGVGLELVDGDTDLDAIRQRPEFRRAVEAARVLRPMPSSEPNSPRSHR